MSKGMVFLTIGIFVLTGHLAFMEAVELRENDTVVVPDMVTGGITVDGELNEAVWKLPSIDKEFKTVSPTYGESLGRETKIWTAYDKKNLYFAFKCFDPEPQKIKTSISRRDNIGMDDFVGIQLDASGGKQTRYDFLINPNGIQQDAVSSAVSVDGADKSPDFVWDSAGKITPEGYQVEVRIPLKSIRYRAGKTVKMGIIFLRQISRLGTVGAWPEIKPGQTSFNFMATLFYKDLKSGLKLEVLPNFTYSRNQERPDPGSWAAETDTNIGVSVKYGITSSITAEATVNPDFSQVESDTFQVEVNQRYPLFYSEKRPFFMESKEILDFGVVKWGMMPVPIHTRLIVDPGWAAKFSGSAGKMNFAFLAANDRSPGRSWESGINPDEGKSAFFGIVRAKYNIGSDNSIGVLYSGRHFAGSSNNAAGVDLKYRLSKNIRSGVSYLYSATRETEGGPLREGNAWNAMLEYRTPTFFSMAAYERYDIDFLMSTAFLSRGGIDRLVLGAGPIFRMKMKRLPWLKGILPYAYFLGLHDLETKMNDKTWLLGVTLNFAPMGMINFEYYREDEAWAGRLFGKNYVVGIGQIQLFKWLYLNGNFTLGDSIYYHPEDPFLGDGRTYGIGATVQPGMKLKISFDYLFTDLRRDKENAYSVNIYNLRTTYQFNKYFFLRGILRYDSYREKLLTDFLASFTLIPGTVVHLGYGSLYMKDRWVPGQNRWVPGGDEFTEMKRGLFFKASYLWRFD